MQGKTYTVGMTKEPRSQKTGTTYFQMRENMQYAVSFLIIEYDK